MKLSELYDKTSPEDIERYAKELEGKTFNEVVSLHGPSKLDESGDLLGVHEDMATYHRPSRKGGLGNLIEEHFFFYKANSESEPDFPEAGVELKVTPYEIKKNGKKSAGERLVLTMISYADPVEPELFKSHLWDKCKLILLVYYLRDKSIPNNKDYRIDYVKLFTPPDNDLEIIKQDYKLIVEKVAAGKAHELSEGDTMYLGACTKGATAEKSTVPQELYNPDVPARKRAFCFKTTYMTYVLNNYIAADVDTYESIVKDTAELEHRTFEQIITEKINQYVGKTDKELCEILDREYNNNKAQWSDLAFRMLGIKSNKAAEFEKAQIVVKAIRIEENGTIQESSPLPPFSFRELAQEEWEDSTVHNYFDETKFFFVVFKKTGEVYKLQGCQLWNMPYDDLNETVRGGWERIRQIIVGGVQFAVKEQRNGPIIKNNLPKKGDNRIIHIRPHASKAFYVLEGGACFGSGNLSDTDELPDGRRMTKQSFWLNNDYILSQLNYDLLNNKK